MPSSGYVWMGNAGCLFPLLIICNLFFGTLIFGSTGLWLGVEGILILIFMLKIKVMVSRLNQQFRHFQGHQQSSGVSGKIIDVQGQEVKDNQQLE